LWAVFDLVAMKRCWIVTLLDGTLCTMIIEDPCTKEDAIKYAKERFDKRVLIVE